MPRPHPHLVLALLLAAAAPAVARAQEAGPPAAPSVALRFGWPAGTELDVTHRRYRFANNGGQVDSADTSWRFRLRVEAERRRTLVHLVHLERLVAAQPASPIPDGARAPIATLVVDDTGVPTEVRNVQRLLERLRPEIDRVVDRVRGVSAEAVAMMERRYGPEVSQQTIIAEFAQLVAFWIGADLEPGEEYTLSEQRENPVFPGTFVPVQVRFGIEDRFACADGRADTSCVHLVATQTMDPDSVGAAMRRFADGSGLPGQMRIERVAFERRAEVLAEPWTLLPTRMTAEQRLRYVARMAEGDSAMLFDQRGYDEFDFEVRRAPTALQAAAAAGDGRRLDAALRAGERVDAADADGLTPLFLAARAGHEDAVRRLVRARADVDRADRLAADRGDLAALRLLRRVSGRPAAQPGPLDAARAALDSGAAREAVRRYAELALAESPPGVAHAGLARALHAADSRVPLALAPAEAALSSFPCQADALRASRDQHDVEQSAWPGADDAAGAAYSRRLIECHPASGEAWHAEAWFAHLRGDAAATRAALERADSLRFYTPALRALGEWILGQLPPRALYVTTGALDYLPMLLAQARGVRPDVVILNARLLDRPAYVRRARDDHGLPLPVEDAGLDSIARTPWDLWVAVASHWRAESRAGRLGRPYTLANGVRQGGVRGEGRFWPRGGFYELADTAAAAASDPRVLWDRIRPAVPALRGPVTSEDAARPPARQYDLRIDLLVALATSLDAASPDAQQLGTESLAALDSLLLLAERLTDSVRWSGNAELRERVLVLHAGLWRVRTVAGERALARRHLAAATRMDSTDAGIWTARAWDAMLAGRLPEAQHAMQQAEAHGGGFPAVLAGVTLQRLLGRPDSARVLIDRAQAMIDNTPQETRATIGRWVFAHLPASRADSTGPVPMLTVESFGEIEAVVAYHRAITDAARGDPTAAEEAIEEALWLSSTDPIRCWARSLLFSTRSAMRLPPASAEWFRRQEERLTCPPG